MSPTGNGSGSETMLDATAAELSRQLVTLSRDERARGERARGERARGDLARESLEQFGALILVESAADAVVPLLNAK